MKLLLPDTSSFEVFSAIAGVAVGLIMLSETFSPLFPIKSKEFWCLIIVMLAFLQLMAMYIERFNPSFLRGLASLLMGSFWIWFALLQTSNDPTISIVLTVLTGLANYVSFTINFLVFYKCKVK